MGYEQFTLVTYQTVEMFPLVCSNIVLCRPFYRCHHRNTPTQIKKCGVLRSSVCTLLNTCKHVFYLHLFCFCLFFVRESKFLILWHFLCMYQINGHLFLFQYLERRFNRATRVCASLLFIINMVMRFSFYVLFILFSSCYNT